MSDLTDEQLAKQAQKGDIEAFNVLIKRHTNHIYNFVRQYSPHTEDAEDTTQDTFLKAWKHLSRFKTEKKFLTWLFTIARNTAIDRTKKQRSISFSRMETPDDDLSFSETLPDLQPLPPELFEHRELAHELKDALLQIHPDHRTTLLMHYQEDMTFEEIAVIMKKPMNTVKSWHRRALSKVKNILMHQGRNDGRI